VAFDFVVAKSGKVYEKDVPLSTPVSEDENGPTSLHDYICS